MKICRPTLGDEHVTWNPEKSEEVEVAKRKFDEALGQGLRAFPAKTVPDEEAGPLKEFDPSLSGIVLVPALQGG